MNHFPIRRTLLLLTVLLISINVSAQQDRPIPDGGAGEPPKVGLRVLDVLAGSPAASAGLQSLDIISKYGDSAVVDAASYFAARDAHQRSPRAKVEIVYWRGRQKMTSIIAPGRMGIKFNEYNPVNYQLDSLMQRLNILIEAPGFSEGQVAPSALPPRDKLIEQIEAAIQKAASDGSLTAAQILVAKINAIPDDSSPADIEKLSELLNELTSTQPFGFVDYLSYEVFFTHKRYRAAVACFKKTLESRPGDANGRLDLGIAYWHLQKYPEADAAADYALQHTAGLTQHGYVVAYEVKASAALGNHEFDKALDYADQASRLDPESGYIRSLSVLAGAASGDLAKFNDLMRAFEKDLPAEYLQLRPRLDALEAFVLMKNGQVEKARLLASKSIGTVDPDANAKYWLQYPTGEDVMAAWRQLLARN
jgi:tetratricopeptide (TPR) repeat protein